MKTELYIKDTLVELDESVSFAITKGFNDLTNPTSIINEWTKEVNIPFTNSNHRLFGHLYNPNKEITDTEISVVGIDFNPNLRFDFTLLHNGTTIMKGYMKMNSITRESGKGSYNITLNGMLGEVFNKMKDIGFKNSEYPINDSKYINTAITKELVCHTFDNQPNSTVLSEDYAIIGDYEAGYYYKYDKGMIYKVEDLSMCNTKVTIQPNTAYSIKNITPSPNMDFYTVILFKGNHPIIALYNTDENKDEIYFTNTVFTQLAINSSISRISPVIVKKNDPSSIIGFTPTNSGYYPNFDSTTFCKTDEQGNTIGNVTMENELANSSFPTAKYTTESAIGDGLLPRQVGEFRSYYQQPYIYFNKLFQMFASKAKEVTGYEFDLDADWFNEDNPYWAKLCMLLKPLKTEEVSKGDINTYYIMDYSPDTVRHYWDINNCQVTKEYQLYAHSYTETSPIYNPSKKTWSISKDYITKLVTENLNSKIQVEKLSTQTEDNYLRLSKAAICKFRLHFRNSSGTIIKTRKFAILSDQDVIFNSDGTYSFSGDNGDYKKQQFEMVQSEGYSMYFVPEKGEVIGDYNVWNANIPLQQELYFYNFGEVFSMDIESEWTENFVVLQNQDVYQKEVQWLVGYNNWSLKTIEKKRSFSFFSLSDLWDEKTSVYDTIVNYTKIFGLLWEIDYVNKKIKITRRVNFFKDYTIENWSDKVDYNQGFTITPLIIESKYMKFNYSDLETNINNSYKEEFNVNYGEMQLDTNYKFNNDTQSLFDAAIPPSITSSDSMISYPNMINGSLLLHTNTEIYPDLNIENKPAEAFGSYFFRNDNQPIDTNLSGIAITDDTDLMQETDHYNYILNTSLVNVASPQSLPYLSIKNTTGEGYLTGNLCIFNTPQTTYSTETYDKKSIYYNFWQDYLNERYSNKTKKVTCWMYLTPMDYYNFKFNKFVLIDNQLYFVNKIYDYDVEKKIATKVDLLTVNDIRNFYMDNYRETIFELNTNRIVTSQNTVNNIQIYTNKLIDTIECPYPYKIALTSRDIEKDIYTLSFTADTTGNIIIKAGDNEASCEVIVSNIESVFNVSPTEVEFEADGVEHSVIVTIDTNQIIQNTLTSSNVKFLSRPDGRFTLTGKSSKPTTGYVEFRLRNGDIHRINVVFTISADLEVRPSNITINKYVDTVQTTTFKIISNYAWEIIGDLPSTITFDKYEGVGETTIQVTSYCAENIIIPLSLKEENGRSVDFSINIISDTYLYATPTELYFPSDGVKYEGFITVDTNVDYYATIDMNTDGSVINMTKTDEGIDLQCSSDQATTKHLCISSILGEKYITINFI